ncbi:MAG: hypothetical protein WBX21_11935, partial [Aestuariivirga sp.]
RAVILDGDGVFDLAQRVLQHRKKLFSMEILSILSKLMSMPIYAPNGRRSRGPHGTSRRSPA